MMRTIFYQWWRGGKSGEEKRGRKAGRFFSLRHSTKKTGEIEAVFIGGEP
jgi:hypothetical protein